MGWRKVGVERRLFDNNSYYDSFNTTLPHTKPFYLITVRQLAS